ncbi:hypothetical protein V3331_13275 [Gaopeijia maritima]|uniref:hypothetical protein n=1 Tax=Gaopeijia maritima TaxID=3119007 RepID=UPI0032457FAB
MFDPLKVLCSATLALIGAGCADGGSEGADSTPAALATYTLSAPLVSIGSTDGEEPYLLDGVADAVVRQDGSLAVLNCGSAEIRVYDTDGRYLRTFGGRGEGPGEFMFPGRMFALGGDTMAVTDFFPGRLTVLGPEGDAVATSPSAGPGGAPQVRGRLANGLFVATRREPAPEVEAGAPFRETMSLLLVTLEGEVVDSVTGLPARAAVAPPEPRSPTRAQRMGGRAVFAVAPDAVYYGGQDGRGITRFAADLSTTESIETFSTGGALTQDHIDAHERMREAREHLPEDGIGPSTAAVYPDELPAFGAIAVGRDGRLWVEDPERPGVQALTWTAYEDGVPTARLELPPRFFALDFDATSVLGIHYDELSVERVQVRAMVEGPLPGVSLPPRDAQPPASPRCGAYGSR